MTTETWLAPYTSSSAVRPVADGGYHILYNSTRLAQWPADTPTNISSNNTPSLYPLLKQPAYMVVTLSFTYGLVFLCAIVGNLCVVAVVVKDKVFHSATYFLIGNLAMADLTTAIVCHPFTLLSNLYYGWPFGAFMCKAVPYLQGVAVCASVNTLVVIAVDRYLAICHVMRQRNTKRMARITLVVIWVFALTLMTPWALFYKLEQYQTSVQVLDICLELFPRPWQKKAYFLGVIFLGCYALPLAFIVVCYFMIGYRVWHRDAPGVISSMGLIEKSKIRVVKMLLLVVVLFIFSWLPLYSIRLKMMFFPPPENSQTMNNLHKFIIPFAQWLGTSNSCMNPLVYCLFSLKIRRRIRAMLCCSKPELRRFHSKRSMCSNAQNHHSAREVSRGLASGVSFTNDPSTYGCQHRGECLTHYSPNNPNYGYVRQVKGSNMRSTYV